MALWWPFARAYERCRLLTVPPRYDPIAEKSQE
jgi:hypothetical protein